VLLKRSIWLVFRANLLIALCKGCILSSGPVHMKVITFGKKFPDSPEFSGSPRHSESRHLYAR
jgi:hypothetical protein